MLWYKYFSKQFAIIVGLLFNCECVISQAIRITESKYQLSMSLVEPRDEKFCNLLDTILFYQKKCVFTQEGTYISRIDLFKHPIDEKLLVEYSGFSFDDIAMEYVAPPAACIIYENYLFLIYMITKSNQEDIKEWLNNQFDKLFTKLDTNHIWIYDLNDFGYIFRSMFEYDRLKIKFSEKENSYEILEKEACIENKSDIYIHSKERKMSDNKKHRKTKKLERKYSRN